jgi:hypothetical protein
LILLPGSTSTPWQLVRIPSMDVASDFVPGFLTAIEAGSTYADAVIAYTGPSSPTIGATALPFAVVSQRPQAAEQVTSGALSPAIRTSILSIVGTKGFTLASGTTLGQRKTIFVRAASGTPAGTITPAAANNFDTLEGTAAGQSAELEWNGNSWDLVRAVGVTVA